MGSYSKNFERAQRKRQAFAQEVRSIGEVVQGSLDRGNRQKEGLRDLDKPVNGGIQRSYRKRSPTQSERMNRALAELGLSAFKVHTLIWQWRGAPARGTLPYFTIRSLEKFCHLTRPTVRVALAELVHKGYIVRLPYNAHHKNALYRLVPVRSIPPPSKKH